jgi:hypothetical protein
VPMLEYKVLSFKVQPAQEFGGEDSDTESDVPALVADMETTLNKMAVDGWRVVSVHSVLSGQYQHGYEETSTRSSSYGLGYSLTDAFVVVLEREKSKGAHSLSTKEQGQR